MVRPSRALGVVGAAWGIAGVFALLSMSIYRLGARALEAWDHGLTASHWAAVAVVVPLMAYSEGYRGFQQRFSPRTAARFRYLRESPDALRSLFAPLFALGLFHATRRLTITVWVLYVGIVALILLVRLVDQPWRGVIDASVVTGLGWGLASLAVCTVQALTRTEYATSPEVPE
jgi:hypothetical protein